MTPCTLAPVPTLRLPSLAESPMTWGAMALPVLVVLAIAGLKLRYRLPVTRFFGPFVMAISLEVYVTLVLALSSPLQRHLILWASAERVQLTSHGCSLAAFNAQYAAAEATEQQLILIGTICFFTGLAVMFIFLLALARHAPQGRAGAASLSGTLP